MYRPRESDTVRFLLYLNITEAIIVPVKEGGLPFRGETQRSAATSRKRRARRRRKTGWHFSVSLLPLAAVTNYYK